MRLTIVIHGSLISQRWARTSVGSPGWAPGYGLYRLGRADGTMQKMREGAPASRDHHRESSARPDLHTEGLWRVEITDIKQILLLN